MEERPNTAGVHVRLHQPLLTEIQDFRRSEIDLPSLPEALRRLAKVALARQAESTSNGEAAE
jgi:hypothetical protein